MVSSRNDSVPDESGQLHLLTAPIDHPEMLDRLWSHFSSTGDLTAVYRIVSVLDWPDLVRQRLNKWLTDTPDEMWTDDRYHDCQQLFIQCVFPINCANRTIDGPLDLDLHVALMAQSGNLQFKELPIDLSPSELVRAAMKSAALWSLRSFSQHNHIVARLCDEEATKPGGAARALLATTGSPG